MTPPATSPRQIYQIKLIMVWGIALLWLLDSALQAQPEMFTLNFVVMVMQPSIAIAPSFLGTLSAWTVSLISAHPLAWNVLFVLIQFAIACALIVGLLRRDQRLIRGGLFLSIFWGLGVWVFGEGSNGVLTGSGTMLTGAPGAVILYVAIAVLYLLPDRWWQLSSRVCIPRDLLSVVFFYGAVAQLTTPAFWGPQGTALLIEGQASMAPSWMLAPLTPMVTLTHSYPVLANAVFGLTLLAVGILLFGRTPRVLGFAILPLVLAFIWFWGEAIGGIFSGMGTDPGSVPLLALLAVPPALAWRQRAVLATGVHARGKPAQRDHEFNAVGQSERSAAARSGASDLRRPGSRTL
ncbi:MAG: hypothetical protein ACRENY_07475 [Candidatus Dormibacteria bacterium]